MNKTKKGNVKSIDPSLLGSFRELKTLIIELYNFTGLFRPYNMQWLSHLPQRNQTNKDNKNDLVIHFNDKLKLFKYADKDFCTFQHFDPSLAVFPVIKTQENLNCSSCTITWLIQNWKLYRKR